MANSSRARALNQQNTAVLYYEPSENANGAPVWTAPVVGVGTTAAAQGGSGATLQLLGRMLEGAPLEAPRVTQPQVVEVEPPRRAAARRRPMDKLPTQVIAYNVHIVASDGAEADDETRFVDTEARPANRPEMPDETRYWAPGAAEPGLDVPPWAPERQYDMRSGSHWQRAQELELTERVQRGTVEPQFVLPNRRQRTPQNEQFQAESLNVPMPGAARPDMPRAAREHMHFAMPENTRAHIPMSLFGALEKENMGTIRAHVGSYKQHLAAGQGPLFSNRNLCIAVGAYALILFMLALFTG